MPQNLDLSKVFNLLAQGSYGYGWFLGAFVAAYLVACFWYWRLSKKTLRHIYLAPVAVRGGLAQELGSREAGLLLRAQLDAIRHCFNRDRGRRGSFTAEAVAYGFRTVQTALAAAPLELHESEVHISDEWVLTVGPVRVPVGALANLVKYLFQILPAFRRRQYLNSIIHVSLVSSGEWTQLLVYRGPRPAEPKKTADSTPQSPQTEPRETSPSETTLTVLARTRKVKDLSQLSALLREAAFDVLELHGQSFPGHNGQSMMHFADGLESMDEYRRKADPEALQRAEDQFAQSVDADPQHHEALHFLGSLLLAKRTRDSISRALAAFSGAVESPDGKLRALAHTGLANCYQQRIHRLAMGSEEVRRKAEEHAAKAIDEWHKSTERPLHPWILRSQAAVLTAEEDHVAGREEAKRRFLHAVDLLHRALEQDPEDPVLHNNLGWTLLKLATWGVELLEDIGPTPAGARGNPAQRSEEHLLYALDRSPANKLVCANLCLVYATPHFLKDGPRSLERCRFYGERAVQIDPGYINGYRDLAVSLIRFARLDEAYDHFRTALALADNIAKDREIMDDAAAVLKEMGIHGEELARWTSPDPVLLVPGVMDPATLGRVGPASAAGPEGWPERGDRASQACGDGVSGSPGTGIVDPAPGSQPLDSSSKGDSP